MSRYDGIDESPRDVLARIPGVELVEPTYWKKDKDLCCGAGGAQMWMEEQNNSGRARRGARRARPLERLRLVGEPQSARGAAPRGLRLVQRRQLASPLLEPALAA